MTDTTRNDGAANWSWLLALIPLGATAGAGLAVVVIVAMFVAASGAAGAMPSSVPGIPPVMLQAYAQAAAKTQTIAPGCTGMKWSILAGIAQIESGQAAGRTISADGDITPPILGPRLDGSGAGGNTSAIHDSDDGRWDGDTSYDRAVGPFQFIPSSWSIYGQDGNSDGTQDPNNAFDAASGAVAHLCGTGERNLSDAAQLRQAILGYNHSVSYVQEVLRQVAHFDQLGATAAGGASEKGEVASCAGGDAQAYVNGQIPIAVLCPLWQAPGEYLQRDAAAAFERLSKAYAAHFGEPICVTDSYRTYAEQVRLRAQKPNLAAKPGTSNHGWGTALDLCGGIQDFGTPQHNWMRATAPGYAWMDPGWARAGGSKPEPWHWEFMG